MTRRTVNNPMASTAPALRYRFPDFLYESKSHLESLGFRCSAIGSNLKFGNIIEAVNLPIG